MNIATSVGLDRLMCPSVLGMIGYVVNPAGVNRASVDYSGRQIESKARIIVDYSGKGRSTLEVAQFPMDVTDLRPAAKEITLERNGFELAVHDNPMVARIANDPDFDGDALQEAADDYHAGMIRMIKARTGARDVIPLRNGLILRRPQCKLPMEERVASTHAHIDFTERSARDYVLIAMAWERIQEIRPYSRRAIFQTWHVLSPPPQDYPLVFCDMESVRSEDLFYIDYYPPTHRVDIQAEVHAVGYNPAHRWAYFSNMTTDELILFKGFDTDGSPICCAPPHTSFRDPNVGTDCTPRASIEARYLALFD